jgi:hypothetical protein
MFLRLRQARNGEVVRESKPLVYLQRRETRWHADVLDVFAYKRTIPPGDYLLDMEIMIEDERISFNDVPITIAKREFGY